MSGQRMLIGVLIVGLLLALAVSPGSPSVRATAPARPDAAYLTADQAAAVVVNDLQATPDGYRLRHPRHTAIFTPEGVQFAPRGGELEWTWRLAFVGAGDAPLAGVTVGPVPPMRQAQGVTYPRGGLVEQYLARQGSLEQQFVLRQPLPPAGADLVIASAVACAGAFEETADGWLWRTSESSVYLGRVRVYDARGTLLPATMAVTAHATRIVVDGAALSRAAYPVTIDPEIGTNDFRISYMSTDTWFDAYRPAVAFNSQDNEYLVVWCGDDSIAPLVDGEYEIFGQRVDAATGVEISADFRISTMGPDWDTAYGAFDPAVAYNSQANEYLVVWVGDDNTYPLADEEFEVFGQRLDATGNPVGTNDFRISGMTYDADDPAVAYNSRDNEYLVVWEGDDSYYGDEWEIFGQRLDASGTEIGTYDFRISDMGPDENMNYDAYNPAVAYNSRDNEYLVVWYGDDNIAPLVAGEFEIFGQRLSASGGELGTNDFRISRMGTDRVTDYAAYSPAVAYNSQANEYLVVWAGDDNTFPLVEEEFEIYGQRLDADGDPVGTNDFRISHMGPDRSAAYDAWDAEVAYNSHDNRYLVVWHGEDDAGALVNDEYEIYGQRLDADGDPVGTDDFRLSDMGPDGNTDYEAGASAVAYGSTANEYLVVWYGDDNTAPLVDDEYEIFGQRLSASGSQVGTNDFRISDMGGDDRCDAFAPAVAYNSQDHEYLVVWHGDDDASPLVDGENEIFGQRVNAATGARIGLAFRISDMGPDGDINFDAYYPDAAYNSQNNEYLVVWYSDDDRGILVDEELEIWGQRLDADGSPLGDNDFRISSMGPDGSAAYDAVRPAVAYNSLANEYLVVWRGDTNTPPLVGEDFEIFGQRLNATGRPVGTNDFRISDMGPDGISRYNAHYPAVAYNSTDNEYLVVWYGDDNTAPLVDGENEIFGQRLDAGGNAVGTNDFRISRMGPDGDAAYGAFDPAVAYNSTDNEYLVVWYGDDHTAPLVNDESEIFGQRLDATGGELGTNDFRISRMGPDGDAACDAIRPAVTYNSTDNEYLVVWEGDALGALADDEVEIYGQRVSAAGGEVSTNDFRLSDMGPDGNAAYDAFSPAVAHNGSPASEYLVVWYGDDDTPPLMDDEYEIYGQRFYVIQWEAEYWAWLPIVLCESP